MALLKPRKKELHGVPNSQKKNPDLKKTSIVMPPEFRLYYKAILSKILGQKHTYRSTK